MVSQVITIAILLIAQMNVLSANPASAEHVLSSRAIDMNNRYSNSEVSDVFKDNILLNLAYIRGDIKPTNSVDWNKIEKPFHFSMTLHPNDTYAFHDNALPEYKGKVVRATNVHFDSSYGFKSDGYLIGDGVCHLASLMYWAARDAKLVAVAPTNHDFATINGVPKEYGVAIYYNPGDYNTSARENLYITNNQSKDIIFAFDYNGSQLKVSVME